jgi:hypothetical protein
LELFFTQLLSQLLFSLFTVFLLPEPLSRAISIARFEGDLQSFPEKFRKVVTGFFATSMNGFFASLLPVSSPFSKLT